MRIVAALVAVVIALQPLKAERVRTVAELPDVLIRDAVLMADGGVLAVGEVMPESPRSDADRFDAIVVRVAADGEPVERIVLAGSANDSAVAAAVDEEGSFYVAVQTTSNDLPGTPGSHQPNRHPDNEQAFVAKWNAGGELEFQTYLGGQAHLVVRDLVVNPNGEAYVSGQTIGPGFTATPEAAVRSEESNTGFVAQVSADGSRLEFVVRGIGSGPIALDADQNLYLGGAAIGNSVIPVTDGAFQPTHEFRACGGSAFVGIPCIYGYVAKLNPAGSKLEYATFLTGAFGSTISAISVDEQGEALVAGTTRSADFPTTQGALLEEYISAAPPPPQRDSVRPSFFPPPGIGFVARLNRDGSGLSFSTFFGGTVEDTVEDLVVAEDSILISGRARSQDLPGLDAAEQCLPAGYLAEIAADGTAAIRTTPLFGSDHGMRILRGGPLLLAGASRILAVDDQSATRRVQCVADAASLERLSSIAPGQLLSLFGRGLAREARGAVPDARGVYPQMLGDVTVSMGGQNSHLLYVSGEQVNAQAPYELGVGEAELVLENGALGGEEVSLEVVERLPALFLQHGGQEHSCPELSAISGGRALPLALNEDGMLNRCSSPARAGSTVTVFLHGLGADPAAPPTGGSWGAETARSDVAVEGIYEATPVELSGLEGSIGSVWKLRLRLAEGVRGRAVFKLVVEGREVAPGEVFVWVEQGPD